MTGAAGNTGISIFYRGDFKKTKFGYLLLCNIANHYYPLFPWCHVVIVITIYIRKRHILDRVFGAIIAQAENIRSPKNKVYHIHCWQWWPAVLSPVWNPQVPALVTWKSSFRKIRTQHFFFQELKGFINICLEALNNKCHPVNRIVHWYAASQFLVPPPFFSSIMDFTVFPWTCVLPLPPGRFCEVLKPVANARVW